MKKISIHIILFILVLGFAEANAESHFPGKKIKEACKSYIEKRVTGDTEIQIDSRISDQMFPEDDVHAKINGNPNTFRGRFNLVIEFYLGEEIIKRVTVAARVKIFEYVAVASHTITRGEKINRGDYIFERREVGSLPKDIIRNEAELEGSTSAVNIKAGSVIGKNALQETMLVKRGDNIRILVENGSVRITAAGEALQDAAAGTFIFVKREDGSKVKGEVLPDGTVAVRRNR
jgi:flagella basal body P-ring formation protein FlgA